MSASKPEIILAYRHLYQHLLRAVQYSKPARYTVRDRLRHAFRNSPSDAFDQKVISNTSEFLSNATKTAGLEHKIVKNLAHVYWARAKDEGRRVTLRKKELDLRRRAYVHFDETVNKLNQTMGICLG